MKRRSFILGGTLSLSLAGTRAQSSAPKRLGWLMPFPPTKPSPETLFMGTLQKLGWIEGKNLQVERRYVGDAADQEATVDARAKEIVSFAPDVIVTATSPAVDALRRETKTIPIVFVGVNNPLAAGFVSSLAHPGGNMTGFANVEPTILGKMIELLKEVAPATRTVALMYGHTNVSFKREWFISPEAADQASSTYAVKILDNPIANEQEIDRAFAKLGEDRTTAVIVMADAYLLLQRNLVIAAAARYRVPAIFPFPVFPASGGLISYGSRLADQFREAADYVDRILKGAHPGDLPVQMPTKYELVINVKAARALGIDVPLSLLSTADKVIE